MNQKKTILTILTSFLMVACYGQTMNFSNSSKSKTIKQSDIVEVILDEIEEEQEVGCCDYTMMFGNIVSVNKDSILMNVNEYSLHTKSKLSNHVMIFDWEEGPQLLSVSKKAIAYLSIYKSKKKVKTKENLSLIGGLLIVGGTLTAVNTLLVGDKGHKKNLLIAGGVQVGLGLTLAIASGSKKKYYFKGTGDPWKFD